MTDYEADSQEMESNITSSPVSGELREFEAYLRTEVPQIVEARLRAELSTEMASIVETLRPQLVELIRDSQSKAAENFRSTRALRLGTDDEPQISSSQATHLAQPREIAALANWDFLQQPVYMDNEGTSSAPRSTLRNDTLDNFSSQFDESPQEPILIESCGCACHVCIGPDLPSKGMSGIEYLRSGQQDDPGSEGCDRCSINHIDWNISLNQQTGFDDF